MNGGLLLLHVLQRARKNPPVGSNALPHQRRLLGNEPELAAIGAVEVVAVPAGTHQARLRVTAVGHQHVADFVRERGRRARGPATRCSAALRPRRADRTHRRPACPTSVQIVAPMTACRVCRRSPASRATMMMRTVAPESACRSALMPLDVHADLVEHPRQLALRLVDDRRRRAGEVVQLEDESDREKVRHDCTIRDRFSRQSDAAMAITPDVKESLDRDRLRRRRRPGGGPSVR